MASFTTGQTISAFTGALRSQLEAECQVSVEAHPGNTVEGTFNTFDPDADSWYIVVGKSHAVADVEQDGAASGIQTYETRINFDPASLDLWLHAALVHAVRDGDASTFDVIVVPEGAFPNKNEDGDYVARGKGFNHDDDFYSLANSVTIYNSGVRINLGICGFDREGDQLRCLPLAFSHELGHVLVQPGHTGPNGNSVAEVEANYDRHLMWGTTVDSEHHASPKRMNEEFIRSARQQSHNGIQLLFPFGPAPRLPEGDLRSTAAARN